MMSQYNGHLKEELIKKTCIAGNARIELSGTLGHSYYKEKTDSINNLFGNYVLISDNFGGIERWGTNISYKADKDLEERCDKVEATKMNNEIENRIILTKAERINFCKVINSLVQMNPSIPFVFRPHPVVNPKFWYDNLVQKRNLHIIYKDSVQPWINGAITVLHSGCSVGIEAELSKNIAIDISDIYKDKRTLGLSSKISTFKPKSVDELHEIIIKLARKDNKRLEKQLDNISTLQILRENMGTMNQDAVRKMECFGHIITQTSALKEVYDDIKEHNKNNERAKLILNKNLIKFLNDEVGYLAPSPEKARYYTGAELAFRLKKAQEVLNRNSTLCIRKLRRQNVFVVFNG